MFIAVWANQWSIERLSIEKHLNTEEIILDSDRKRMFCIEWGYFGRI